MSEQEGSVRVVGRGECIESLAHSAGHHWRYLWDHPENAELKALRKDPNVLKPGDKVFVPEHRIRTEKLATTKVHRFRRKGIPSKLSLRFLDEGEPRANQVFTLDVDGVKTTGKTDGDGRIEQPISPSARRATVYFEDEIFTFALGGVDPADTPEGAAHRLRNLGFKCPSEDPEDDAFQDALRAFQHSANLPRTGELNEATSRALRDQHGC